MANTTNDCPLCGFSETQNGNACGQCGASWRWKDFANAVIFSRNAFVAWKQRGLINDAEQKAMDERAAEKLHQAASLARQGAALPTNIGLPSAGTCWRCSRTAEGHFSYCNSCGALLGKGADSIRYLAYVYGQIARAHAAGLPLAKAHALQADVRGHSASLRAELERSRLSSDELAATRMSRLKEIKSGSTISESGAAEQYARGPAAAVAEEDTTYAPTDPPADEPPPVPHKPAKPSQPRRTVLEILLDPRSIQWLLASGGVLLVVGLVIWLASLGVFKNVMVVALCMGAGTLAVMGSGIAVIKMSRFQLAGRALTLLACLVMPLNLWFYHSHKLVTLEGHLWVAALICCVLYAAAAIALEDPVFVYVLNAGIAMTGLLILGDLHRLWEVASPSALLVVLGLIALHAERAFADRDGPFSRKRFGMACFWSAQGLIGLGLILLLGAQIEGWLPRALSWVSATPLIVSDETQRLLAIGLVLAGVYAYAYSDLVVRRKGIYVYIAAFLLLWAELLIIDLVHLTNHPPALIAVLALTALGVNVLQAVVLGQSANSESAKLTRPLPPLGLFLAFVPAVLGIVLHMRATDLDVHQNWPYSISWGYVGAMALTAICCRISAYLSMKRQPKIAAAHLAATAAATLLAAAGLLSLLDLKTWPIQCCILMLIPTAYLLASRLYKGRPSQMPLATVAHLATVVLIFSAIFSALQLTRFVDPVTGSGTNLLLSLFCAEAAVFYALGAIFYGQSGNVYASTFAACGAVWQLLNFWDVRTEYYCVTFVLLGLTLLIAYRLATLEKVVRPALVQAAFRCANALLSLSFLAAALMSLSRMATDQMNWSTIILLASFAGLSVFSAALVRHSGFRRWYLALAITEGALTIISLEQRIHLSPWRHVESFTVAVGLAMLCFGYAMWYREQDRHSDSASFCLLLGSLLAGCPLAIAAIGNRFWFDISLVDEFGLATVSVLMFVTGFMCRLRAPTLVGGFLLVVHLAMLVVSAGMRAQLAVGVYLSAGGAAIFAVGVLLSIYRDSLLQLPKQIRSHAGVFSVLAWR